MQYFLNFAVLYEEFLFFLHPPLFRSCLLIILILSVVTLISSVFSSFIPSAYILTLQSFFFLLSLSFTTSFPLPLHLRSFGVCCHSYLLLLSPTLIACYAFIRMNIYKDNFQNQETAKVDHNISQSVYPIPNFTRYIEKSITLWNGILSSWFIFSIMTVRTKKLSKKNQIKRKITRIGKILWAPVSLFFWLGFIFFPLFRQNSHWLSDTDVFLSAGEGANSHYTGELHYKWNTAC